MPMINAIKMTYRDRVIASRDFVFNGLAISSCRCPFCCNSDLIESLLLPFLVVKASIISGFIKNALSNALLIMIASFFSN